MAIPRCFRCPDANDHGSPANPDYGVNRFALGVLLDSVPDPTAAPLTMDTVPGTAKQNYQVQNLLSDISTRHSNGTIVSFFDGHVQWCAAHPDTVVGVEEPFFNGSLDLLAACPLIYQAAGPYSATVNNATYLAQGGTPGLWPRFQTELRPLPITAGKQNGAMPNLCLQYNIVSSSGATDSPSIAVGIMKPQGVVMADNGTRGVDFLPGITLAGGTYTPASAGVQMWFFDGTWQQPGLATTSNIPRSDFGQFLTNVRMRGTIVGLQGIGHMLGAKSNTDYTVFLDQSTTPTGWNIIPDGQLGVYFFGWCDPGENDAVTIRNITVRQLPAWTPKL